MKKNRMEREEVCKVQKMARFKKKRDLLMQERSVAVAKDAAVLAFLQKFSDQSGIPFSETLILQTVEKRASIVDINNNESNHLVHGIGSSRWPKEEVEALIAIKINLDFQHHESRPRGPLWEWKMS